MDVQHHPRPHPPRGQLGLRNDQRLMRVDGLIRIWFGVVGFQVKVVGFRVGIVGVNLVVAVGPQQLDGPGRLGQDPDRLRPPHVGGVGTAFQPEDVGDPVDRGQKPDHIPRLRSGHQQLQPALRGPTGADETLRLEDLGPFLSSGRVGLDDLRGQQRLEPGPRQGGDQTGDRGVDLRGGVPGQVPGGLGHLPGLPHPHPTGQHPDPDLRQPMPPIQRIGDQRPPGAGRGVLPGTQLRRRELQDVRGALPTQPPAPFPAWPQLQGQTVRMVQIGPVRGQLQE
jgi:hypothetical protein